VRAQLAQLVFEAYGLPAMSTVAAAPAAFYHHYASAHCQQQQQQSSWQQLGPEGVAGISLGLCSSSSGLVVCSGHSATYVVPVYKVTERGLVLHCGHVHLSSLRAVALCWSALKIWGAPGLRPNPDPKPWG
jgi:hypothetical protein